MMKSRIKQTHDLQYDGRTALQRKIPLIVVFSQEDCAYCERLKEEIIEPMLISGDYRNKVIIREFMIDDEEPATDFQGQAVEPISIFQGYDMFVTPTVLILDGRGRELAERMIGINTVDYYGYYLDQAIDQALAKIK